jgi:hypothetical protein
LPLRGQKFARRPHLDSCDANAVPDDIRNFKRLQLHRGYVFAEHHIANYRLDLVEIFRTNVTLKYGNVRLMGGVEGITLLVGFTKPRVKSVGVLDHRRVRLERDVDRYNGGLQCRVRLPRV